MFTLSCKDLGADCQYVAKGESKEEVVGKMMDHAQKAHPDKFAEMSSTMSREEMEETFNNKMVEK